MEHKTFTYDPSVFDINSLEEAQSLILTPEHGLTSAYRWKVETPWLMALIDEKLKPSGSTRTLDYGCGVGRLARPILHKHGGRLVGVDISANMRGLASSLVDHDGFAAVSPAMLDMFGFGVFDMALCIWTLQHVHDPGAVVGQIFSALASEGKLLVVNNDRRVVPVTERKGKGSWADDGISVRATIETRFDFIEGGKFPESVMPPTLAAMTYWAIFQKKRAALPVS